MKKYWKPYALYILDCIEKIHHIKERGDITEDVILYDAILRNLQTLSEATRHLPELKLKIILIYRGKKLVVLEIFLFMII